MNQTTKIITAGVAAVVLIAAAITVKLVWFPGVDESLFKNLTQDKLRQAPTGIVMVRETQYPHAPTNDVTNSGGRGKARFAGRNVTLQQLMGYAYNYNPGKVFVPPDASKNNYDFIVTALSGPQQHLRGAIQKKAGYVASVETRDADIFSLKVVDRTSDGLKASGPDEKTSTKLKDGRRYFTHFRITDIVNPMTYVLKTPVVDKTGLTGFYDFSVQWSDKLESGNIELDDVQAIVKEWGLSLEPDTAPVEMLVVKKAH